MLVRSNDFNNPRVRSVIPQKEMIPSTNAYCISTIGFVLNIGNTVHNNSSESNNFVTW